MKAMEFGAGRKKERTFALTLPAFVEGRNGQEVLFSEQAELALMNADEAILKLRAQVRVGMKLRFAVYVPRTFYLENPLEMALSGTVINIQPAITRVGDHPLVRLRLDRPYAIVARTA
jgi:hypothetical protein